MVFKFIMNIIFAWIFNVKILFSSSLKRKLRWPWAFRNPHAIAKPKLWPSQRFNARTSLKADAKISQGEKISQNCLLTSPFCPLFLTYFSSVFLKLNYVCTFLRIVDEDESVERCEVVVGPPKCSEVELVLPKQICTDIVYGYAAPEPEPKPEEEFTHGKRENSKKWYKFKFLKLFFTFKILLRQIKFYLFFSIFNSPFLDFFFTGLSWASLSSSASSVSSRAPFSAQISSCSLIDFSHTIRQCDLEQFMFEKNDLFLAFFSTKNVHVLVNI